MSKCLAEKCESPSFVKGLCQKHYQRMRKYGDPNVKVRVSNKNKICIICESDHRITHFEGNPYCGKHYTQMIKYGKIKPSKKDKNEIITFNSHSEIILLDMQSNEKARALVSNDKISKVKNIRWRLSGNGYVVGKINGKGVILHRILLNPSKDDEVDHINHNPLDCRNENLRICNRSQNSRNTRPQQFSTSKYKGVYLNKDKKAKSFTVQFTTEFGRISRVFGDEIVAANFYNHLCRIYRYDDIEFCLLNDVPFIDMQTCCDNVSLPEKSNTGVKGIRQIKNGRYRATIYRNSTSYSVGTFDTLEEAETAYNKKLQSIIK